MRRNIVDGLGALREGGLRAKGEGEVGYLKGYTGAFNAALIARNYRGKSIGRFRARFLEVPFGQKREGIGGYL